MAENRSISLAKRELGFGVLSLNNPQFATYLVVTSLLILKMFFLTFLTAIQRAKHKVVISEEDTRLAGGTFEFHPDVERVRRAVRNDLENIPAFLFLALAYLFVGVPDWVVHFLFYLFLVSRTLHTFVYSVYVLPQPSRSLCFFVGFLISIYMSLHLLIYGRNEGKMDPEWGVLSINNPQFATYLIVASLLILKMCGLTLLTIFHRLKNKVFISEEDAKFRGGTVESHPVVERVRRACQNDLENIPAFLFVAFAYLFVRVPDWVVHFLFYLFLIARALHSFVYAIYVIPQPAREICFMVSFLIILYLGFHVLIYGFFVGYLGK